MPDDTLSLAACEFKYFLVGIKRSLSMMTKNLSLRKFSGTVYCALDLSFVFLECPLRGHGKQVLGHSRVVEVSPNTIDDAHLLFRHHETLVLLRSVKIFTLGDR